MKKSGIVCSVVLAALLCVSGITVFALSPETDAANEDAQDREDVVFPAEEKVAEADEAVPEDQEEVALETQNEVGQKTQNEVGQKTQQEMEQADQEQEQVNEEIPALEVETSGYPFENYLYRIYPIDPELYPDIFIAEDVDVSGKTILSLTGPSGVERESYPTLEELKQIRDMTYADQVYERFGVPDEHVMSSGSGLYNWYKYLSSDGGYAIVCTHTCFFGSS
ncbi:MAG: hypothetical protein ACI4WV_06480, partial [Eubacteriales bacterium]